MYKTSKSPRKVLLAAFAVAQDALPAYSHECSPQTYTLHQLFACLALKEFLRCDYRKITQVLSESPELCSAIGLKKVPHFTTLQKRAVALLNTKGIRALLAASLKLARKKSS